MTTSHPGGTAALGGHTVARIGYGAMGLGHAVSDDDAAVAVLRRAVELGVDHDRHRIVLRRRRGEPSDPGRTRTVRRRHRARQQGRSPSATTAVPVPLALAQHPADLRAAVELDLAGLGLEQIPVVNLRRADIGPGLTAEGDQIVDLDDQLAEMIALRDEGKIGAIGISNVDLDTLRRALPAGIECVQNAYNVLNPQA